MLAVSLLSLATIFTLSLPQTFAILRNRTIDDKYGDEVTGHLPRYITTSKVSNIWKNNTCTDCKIKPELSRAHNGTWTAVTFDADVQDATITLNFKGVAIYVYLIVSNTIETNCMFTLDNNNPDSRPFNSPADPSASSLEYNVLAFTKSDIEDGDHQLVISGNPPTTYLNFDYAIYTLDDGIPTFPSPSASTSPTTAHTFDGALLIVGIVFGTVLILVLGIIIQYLIKRQQKSNKVALSNDSLDGSRSWGSLLQQDRLPTQLNERDTRRCTWSCWLGASMASRVSAIPKVHIWKRIQAAQHWMGSSMSRQPEHSAVYQGVMGVETEQEHVLENERLREQIRVLREVNLFGATHRSSDSTLALCNEPPPAYGV
ncbi:hypothetical protein AMATHDRAFT_65349 [Amanita thiersii Skay4041]|uniref:Uncharacterized protein n=1 Tax=Amanita thiersii Skay4041 TaxID=703135 RepID=A0A2A9NLB0_9AGAR|nr:hypothetical protein AMATHDRAFT_65349 [Amanita thiersii Skay4041]